MSALETIGALNPRAHHRRSIGSARRAGDRDHNLWIVCKTDLEGRVTRGTFECFHAATNSRRDSAALRRRQIGGAIARHAGLLASFGGTRC